VLEAAPVEFNVELRRHQKMFVAVHHLLPLTLLPGRYQETAALDQFYQELRRDQPPPAAAPAATARAATEGTTCLACNKRFPSAESLEKHCKLSEQHRRNVGLAAPAAPAAPAPAPAADAGGLRRSGAGLGAAPQPEQHEERPVSYKERGYRATLSRFNQE
jgi:hypothetical protein